MASNAARAGETYLNRLSDDSGSLFFVAWCVDVFHCVGVLIMKFDRYILAVLCCQIPLKDAFFYKKTD